MLYHSSLKQGRVPVSEVVLHCAAVPTGFFNDSSPFEVFSTVNRWHHERGFLNGFGYHGLVMPDGRFYAGRPQSMIGAHVVGHNVGSLGLLLIESKAVDELREFEDFFTNAQREAARLWISSIPQIVKVSGHNDYAPKLCPGFKVQSSDWL